MNKKRLSEEEVDCLVQEVVNFYISIETFLKTKIVQSLNNFDKGKGIKHWYISKLMLTKATLSQSTPTINSFYKSGLKSIKKAFIALGRPDRKKEKTLSLFSRFAKGSTKNWKYFKTKAIESANRKYREILTKMFNQVDSGQLSFNEAMKQAITELSKDGFDYINYESGRKVSIESAVRRDLLSALTQAQNELTLKQCEELGTEFVEVSSHLGARTSLDNPIANHAGWQGGIYHIGGPVVVNGTRYGGLEEETGYGTIDGLGGVNCRHRMFPFILGIDEPAQLKYDEESNDDKYKAIQKQRAYERKIRKLKKRLYMFKSIGDEENSKQVRKELRKVSKELSDWCELHNLTRDYSREKVIEEL